VASAKIFGGQRVNQMQDILWILLFIVGYIALTQWLLPKLGVPT
jgi:hypothetical protein